MCQTECQTKAHEGMSCSEMYNCCDCGGTGCGCPYCWSCNACETCLEAE